MLRNIGTLEARVESVVRETHSSVSDRREHILYDLTSSRAEWRNQSLIWVMTQKNLRKA